MYYFIVNPNSRTGAGEKVWHRLERILKQKQISYHAYLTRYPGHAKKLAYQLSQTDVPRTIVVLGGDGTINEVLNGLILSDAITLGYIPTGSGNDFARGMGIPFQPEKALNCILRKERVQKISVGSATSDYHTHRFIVSTGIGYDAAVCHEILVSPLKKFLNCLHLGKLSYLFIGVKTLCLWHPTPMTVYLDDSRKYYFEKAYFAAFMNQPYEGGGFKFCPGAQASSGTLELCVAANLPKWKILCLIPLALFGKHTPFQGVHILRCRHAVLHSAVPLPVHRDGESGSIRTELIINLEKSTLKVITPVI